MAVDRRPILTLLADKYEVRQYVSERVGPGVLTQLYAVENDPRSIDWGDLPPRFVVKATHASGATILVDERFPRRADWRQRLLEHSRAPRAPWAAPFRIHPEDLDHSGVISLCQRWLRSDYSLMFEEWAYKDIKPRILVEELLTVEDTDAVPWDYKFWCFHGSVAFIQVDLRRLEEHRRSFHHPDWTLIEGEIGKPRPSVPPEQPRNLEAMIGVAERLSSGIDFLRVDLYDTAGGIRFGELTNYPDAGRVDMVPEALFTALGSEWNPSRQAR